MPIERGQIYYVYLDPAFGREIGGYKLRPVAVVSINDINKKPLCVTVVPGTKARGKRTAFRNLVVVSPTKRNGLTDQTIFRCDQLRALDHGRFTSEAIGALAGQDLQLIEEAVKFNLGL